jgi:hypothetical protein
MQGNDNGKTQYSLPVEVVWEYDQVSRGLELIS